MTLRVTPLIRVVDITATLSWYKEFGFSVVSTNDCDGVIDWASLSFGETRVMFNVGGVSSTERREVDLYVHTENVQGLYDRVKDSVEIVEGVHETFYGMREFIARDPSGFWVTFGEPTKKG
jgi:uncharacterized glyoxalase superfamily protein PhnB